MGSYHAGDVSGLGNGMAGGAYRAYTSGGGGFDLWGGSGVHGGMGAPTAGGLWGGNGASLSFHDWRQGVDDGSLFRTDHHPTIFLSGGVGGSHQGGASAGAGAGAGAGTGGGGGKGPGPGGVGGAGTTGHATASDTAAGAPGVSTDGPPTGKATVHRPLYARK